jgi:anti-anti-sigma factor
MDELTNPTEPQFTFELSAEDGSPLLKLAGELDLATTEELEAALAEVINSRPGRLIIDARNLRFADSSAIALWVNWANALDELEIREPPDLLRHILTRMGLADTLRLVP